MTDTTKNEEMLLIEKNHVIPLITRFGIIQNELGQILDLPVPSDPVTQAAVGWWEKLTPESQYACREVLAALASPLIIADIGVNSGNEMLVNTHAIVPSMRWNDPLFLLGEQDNGARFKLERLKEGDLLLNTLLLYLGNAETLYELDMKFEIPLTDFVVFTGMTDLAVRLRYRSLLDHKPYTASMKMDDIVTSVDDAFALQDPRWLLAFLLPVLHTSHDRFSRDAIRASVNNLVRIGLVKSDGGETHSYTEAGATFAESAGRYRNIVRIDAYGTGKDGRNGRQSQIFIRGENFLWYAGIGGKNGDSVVVAALDLAKAEALLKEVFTPVAVPKPVAAPTPAAAPDTGDTKSAQKTHFCPRCGAQVQPGKKFCSQCGAKMG